MDSKTLNSALRHLRKHKHLKVHIGKASKPPFKRSSKPFESLVKSIIYQQLSGKAAGTIFRRFVELFPKGKFPTPEQIAKLPEPKFRSCGVSAQKTAYLKDLAKRFLDGTVEPKKFPKMTDEDIRTHLIAVKGIGPWTADMFLMFTLFRPDVLPTGDLGIQKGFQKVFKLKKPPTPDQMEKLAEDWKPYRTIASWYLWRAVDGENAEW